jgi:hypothetical protein
MKIFTLNISDLIQKLLPTFLRKEVITGFLETLLKPFSWLKGIFDSFRRRNLYELGITSQVVYLEKLLNDRYDSEFSRIKITDGYLFNNQTFIFLNVENRPVYTFLTGEFSGLTPEDKTFIYNDDEYGVRDFDFIVKIPQSLSNSRIIAEMRIPVQQFCLPGMTFDIRL